MSRTVRYLTFEGQFESKVLGTFRIIRGFADIRYLAEVSVPYTMEETGTEGEVKGQQRTIDEEHAIRIKNYLENFGQCFLPEVILSVRKLLTDEVDQTSQVIGVRGVSDDDGIFVKRAWKSQNIRVHRIQVDREKLSEIREKKLIRRVDGNHRLALADQLKANPQVPSKYLAPFCIVLLGPAGEAADDYFESLIFHTINSTALPLESEHALKLILGQREDYDLSPEREFAFNPSLHFTRILRDGLLNLPEPVQSRLGNRPLTSLSRAVRGLLDMDPTSTKNLSSLRKYSKSLLAALTDIVTRLEPGQPSLCKSEFFIELAARVWNSTPDGTHEQRVNSAVKRLEQLAGWLGRDGLMELKEGQSLSKQVIDIFEKVRCRIPKRVFLARWYPTAKDGVDCEKARLRLLQIQQALKDVEKETGTGLHLVDMGTQTGSTFPIHAKMYEAITSSDIILIDLTGVRPNVCVEAGFALRNHERDRLIFIFQPMKSKESVPFDLNTFRYERFEDTGEIPERIKPHIIAILNGAALGS